MKRMHKLFSLFLTLCIAVSALTGYVPANAVSNTAPNRNESFVTENVDEVCNEEFALPDIIDSKEAIENDYIGRVKTEEQVLQSYYLCFTKPVTGEIIELEIEPDEKLNKVLNFYRNRRH